jgi:methyl-accepting chemotaxis protein
LAERSQKAAGEINQLSDSTVKASERAGGMLEKLVPDIQKTAELVQEISAASKEQNTGADQINQALQQLEKVIQQNAAAAEEMASTTEELTSQASQLLSALGFFRTAAEGSALNPQLVRPKLLNPAPSSSAVSKGKRKGQSPTPRELAAASTGVSINLHEGNDHLDKDYERF